MDARQKLQTNLTGESKAYGYTLSVWGSGAVLTHFFGLPTLIEVFLFVAGAVTGYGILALAVYRNMLTPVQTPVPEQVIVASMIHILAAAGTVGIAMVLSWMLPFAWAFLLVGVNASFMYNVLLLVEVFLSEELAAINDT